MTVASGTAQTNEAARLYAEREQRLNDAIALRTPDRTPVAYFSHFWQARYTGRTVRQVMYDYEAAVDAARRAVLDLQPDAMQVAVPQVALGPLLDVSEYGHMRWAGHGVGDNSSYQFLDQEIMKADEYDAFVEDPSYFTLTRYYPRIMKPLAGLAKLPQFAGLSYFDVLFSMATFLDPEIAHAFSKLAEIGAESMRMTRHAMGLEAELVAQGFPTLYGAVTVCPFDYFADCLRGSKGIMLDMYRCKDRLLAAMDRVLPLLIRKCVAVSSSPVNVGRAKMILIPLHWGLDGFMSPDQFKTFYWPSLRKLMVGLIEHGLVPCPLWEGVCTTRLETIADIPRGKAIYWFERTDLVRAKEVLGDVVCLRGNVPPPLLNTGTPDEVAAYCRMLIEKVGKNGGLIVDGAIGIPDEARPENVHAMFRTVREYGS